MYNEIIYLQDDTDLDLKLSLRKERLLELGLFSQPLAAIIGDDLQNIKKHYVIINDIKFNTISTLGAIDGAFKSCYSLQLDFSKLAIYPFLVLQHHIYNLKGESDINRSAVSTFINDLKLAKN